MATWSARTRGAAALVAAGLVIYGAPARALSVSALQIQLDPARRDGFRIAGEFHRAGLDDAETMTLSLDRFVFVLPLDHFKAKRGRHRRGGVLTYHGPRSAAGVAHFVVDRRSGRFVAVGRGLALAGLPNPLRVEVATEGGADCGMLRLQRHAKRGSRARRVRWTLLRHDAGAGCLVVGPPRAEPANVVAGTATDVRFEAQLAKTTDLDPTSVRLFRTDGVGHPAGTALCQLVDDGDPLHGDRAAGDGVFACVASFDEQAPTTIPLVVVAVVGGDTMTSSGFALGVVSPFSPQDAATIMAGQETALARWGEQVGRLGDTLAARAATIAELGAMSGVAEVALAGDGMSIEIRYASGVLGGLMLTPKGSSGAAVGPGGVLFPRPAFLDRRPPSVQPEGDDVALVGNPDVLMFEPGFFPDHVVWQGETVPNNEPLVLRPLFEANACPRFHVTHVQGTAATVGALAALPAYGTVVFDSHGFVDRAGNVSVLTGEQLNQDLLNGRAHDLQGNLIQVTSVEDLKEHLIAFKPAFIAGLGGRFPGSIVYVGACWSANNATLAGAFFAKGATVYHGYDLPVSSQYAADVARQLFANILLGPKTAGDAFDLVSPKLDYDPSGPSRPRDLVIVPAHSAARFMQLGNRSAGYLGDVSLLPADTTIDSGDQLTLTADLPGSDGCDLVYQWSNTAVAGSLTDGDHQDQFESTSKTVTYTGAPTPGGEDTVTVEIDARAPDGQLQKLGTASATVTVDIPYTIAGSSDGASTFVVDDDLLVYLNGALIHNDGYSLAGARAPFSFRAQPGDVLEFVVYDSYGYCTSLSTLYLVKGPHAAVADAGFDLGCGRPGGDLGVVQDVTFAIPF